MQKSLYVLALLVSATIGAAIYGAVNSFATGASHSDGSHANHDRTSKENSEKVPTELGQSAFAAIAEIVQMLNNDPDTDWSRVNIDSLRNHLVDMEMLTTEATAIQSDIEGKIVFRISGSSAAIDAARRMMPAHSSELSENNGWAIETSITGKDIKMVVTPTPKIPANKIKALGFFGIMATGAHHQPHHLGMATGSMIH